MSEIEDRRQRAFEVAEDMIMSGDRPSAAVQEAIEAATQVKITAEVVAAVHRPGLLTDEDALRAAFEAAGFEVVE